MTRYRRLVRQTEVILVFILCITSSFAQYSLGMTGLLNTPGADMQPDGTFMAGGNFLPKEMMPDMWNYNSGNYFLNITFFPFMEVAYRCTLLKGEYKAGNKWQQDRSVSLRLRPLKESRYVPAVVIGSNDVFTTNELNAFNTTGGNRYFASIYGVATKHIYVGEHVFGMTFGSYFFSKNTLYKGVFGGLKYTPAFLQPVSIIAEYDANGVNAGITARLFHHFSLYAFAYDFKAVSCGLRYETVIGF